MEIKKNKETKKYLKEVAKTDEETKGEEEAPVFFITNVKNKLHSFFHNAVMYMKKQQF